MVKGCSTALGASHLQEGRVDLEKSPTCWGTCGFGKKPHMSFTGTLNLSDCLSAESECKQRLWYHTRQWGAPSHSSWHLTTSISHSKQVSLLILPCPQREADADQVCNAPRTAQWAGSRMGGCLCSLTLIHECGGWSLTHAAGCQNQAVSWPHRSCVLPEGGAAPGGLNSLEQQVTRDLVMWIHLGAAHAVCAAGPADGLHIFDGKAEGHGRFPLQNAQFSWKHTDQEETH